MLRNTSGRENAEAEMYRNIAARKGYLGATLWLLWNGRAFRPGMGQGAHYQGKFGSGRTRARMGYGGLEPILLSVTFRWCAMWSASRHRGLGNSLEGGAARRGQAGVS